MAKIKVAVAGCLGRMGQEISKQVLKNKNLEFVGGFEHKKNKGINKPLNKVSEIKSAKLVDPNPIRSIKEANVIIDFTTPEATLENLKFASTNKTAVVIGTTGMTDSHKKKVKSYSKKIPILMSSNMSLGVNLLFNLVQQTASALKDTDYDIEIAETHHKHKKDAPSGTAISIAEAAASKRQKDFKQNEVEKETIKNTRGGSLGGVQIHSARMPGRVARHELVFGGLGQTFTMLHDSIDRQSFMPGVILGVKEILSRKELVVGLDKIMGI